MKQPSQIAPSVSGSTTSSQLTDDAVAVELRRDQPEQIDQPHDQDADRDLDQQRRGSRFTARDSSSTNGTAK